MKTKLSKALAIGVLSLGLSACIPCGPFYNSVCLPPPPDQEQRPSEDSSLLLKWLQPLWQAIR